jgi:hypothetical protein
MEYEVALMAPEINEIITVEAEHEEAAMETAFYTIIRRMLGDTTATCKATPKATPEAEPEAKAEDKA